MEIVVNFKDGSSFSWKNVKSGQVESVAVDIKDLSKKAEEREARKNVRAKHSRPCRTKQA
jgi:hypothetical protein